MNTNKLTKGNISMVGVPKSLLARLKADAKRERKPMHEIIEEALNARDQMKQVQELVTVRGNHDA